MFETLKLDSNVLDKFAEELKKIEKLERDVIILKYYDKLPEDTIRYVLKLSEEEYKTVHDTACKKLEPFFDDYITTQ